jgi:hypothetical protein
MKINFIKFSFLVVVAPGDRTQGLDPYLPFFTVYKMPKARTEYRKNYLHPP